MDITLKSKPDRTRRRRSWLLYIGVAIIVVLVAGAVLLARHLGKPETSLQPGENLPLTLPPHARDVPANPAAQSGRTSVYAADAITAQPFPTPAASPASPAIAQARNVLSTPSADRAPAQETLAEPMQTASESSPSTTASWLQRAPRAALNAPAPTSATAPTATAANPSALVPHPASSHSGAADPTEMATRSPPPTAEARLIEDWLSSRADDHYTIQLIAGYEKQTLERFLDQHTLGDKAHAVQTQYRGRDWYVLITGDYPSRDAAHNAMNRLPQALRDNDLWVRTFASLRP
ncbi:MAG: SPOR domain-containing protein [Nitrococcus sp.]|nr:SPOR domain-containing protein [Nitrococcus sp.]